VLPGRPTLGDISEQLREDGSMISASVPISPATSSIPVITGSSPTLTEHGNLGVDS
jgi:alpha,alpha-trehalose phosphorylase